MESKLEYLFKRLRERMGEQALTSIIEQLYNFTIFEKQPPSKLITRMKSRRGRRSEIERYLNIKNHQEALTLLEEDLKDGKISRRTYFNAKKLLKTHT